MKRVIPATLAATLLIQPVWFTTFAYAEDSSPTGTIYSKDEVIYANLDEVGTVNELYVVNALEVGREGSIIDYGNYDKLTNLTTLSEMTQLDQEQVEINDAPEGMFYYQGNLSTNTNLPWNFDISYVLDGNEVSPEELAGNDGSFELHINVTQNDEVDPAFLKIIYSNSQFLWTVLSSLKLMHLRRLSQMQAKISSWPIRSCLKKRHHTRFSTMSQTLK